MNFKNPIFTFEDLNINDTSPVLSRRPIETEKLKKRERNRAKTV